MAKKGRQPNSEVEVAQELRPTFIISTISRSPSISRPVGNWARDDLVLIRSTYSTSLSLSLSAPPWRRPTRAGDTPELDLPLTLAEEDEDEEDEQDAVSVAIEEGYEEEEEEGPLPTSSNRSLP